MRHLYFVNRNRDIIINKKTIIITGASSGLGRALACLYASPNVRLFLFGRSVQNLEETADLCRKLSAEAFIIKCDIKDQETTKAQIEDIFSKNKVDILISCAGVSAGTLNKPETTKQVNEIFATNLNGTLNIIMPAMPFMIANKEGMIVLISSMAGLIGLSSSPSYSASKAAIKSFGDSLRAYLKRFNVKVSVVIPGYIATPMTEVNNFPMPFIISAERAAEIIVSGLERNKGLIVFPKIMYFTLKLLSLVPYKILDYINSKLPGKPSFDN